MTQKPKKNYRFIIGTVLLILGIVWCLLITNLNKVTFIPSSIQWYIASGVGILFTLIAIIFVFLKRNKSNTKPVGFSWWIFILSMTFFYFTIAFGSLVVVLFLWFNSLFATDIVKKVVLPIKATGATTYRGNTEYYAFVDLEGNEEQIYLNTFNKSTIDLTLQKGKFGFWVVREKNVNILD
jgi:hypothetical protein